MRTGMTDIDKLKRIKEDYAPRLREIKEREYFTNIQLAADIGVSAISIYRFLNQTHISCRLSLLKKLITYIEAKEKSYGINK